VTIGPVAYSTPNVAESIAQTRAQGGVVSGLSIGSLPSEPQQVPSVATPQPAPRPKTHADVAAERMVKHLHSIQRTHGIRAKGNENRSFVLKFQSRVGDTRTGLAGPDTFARAAQHGQSALPLVMYWPVGATSAKVVEYRSVLNKLADQAEAAGQSNRATELRASAARERGQGGITGPLLPS
jgi:hypothetical protein